MTQDVWKNHAMTIAIVDQQLASKHNNYIMDCNMENMTAMIMMMMMMMLMMMLMTVVLITLLSISESCVCACRMYYNKSVQKVRVCAKSPLQSTRFKGSNVWADVRWLPFSLVPSLVGLCVAHGCSLASCLACPHSRRLAHGVREARLRAATSTTDWGAPPPGGRVASPPHAGRPGG